MRNPLKRDPSRTTMLRSRYMADMRRRFSAVSRAIQKLIVKEDALGLVTSEPLTFMQKQAWRFNTDANKIKSYRKWLQQQIDAKILTVDAVSGKPWNATYAESAYRKGMMRAYTQIHATELAKSVDFYEGTKAQFLRDAFAQPITLSKIELMYTRAFDELKGVTAAMGQQMSRTLAAGLLKGDGPRAIARELRKNVSNITKTRAIVIARTEVIMVHAEGQLDSFEMLGVKEVGIMAEWTTAGDDRVCERCGALEGSVMTVDEARGQIPLHPNCRCIWVPYLKGISKRKTRKEIREKLKTAIPKWPSTKRKIKGVEKTVVVKEIDLEKLLVSGSKVQKEMEREIVKALRYCGVSPKDAAGYCDQVSVTLWDSLGKPKGLRPYSVMVGEEEHVLLYSRATGIIVDPTGMQFDLRVFSQKIYSPFKKYIALTKDEIKAAEGLIKKHLEKGPFVKAIKKVSKASKKKGLVYEEGIGWTKG